MNNQLYVTLFILSTTLHALVIGQKYFKGECCEEYCYSTDIIRPQVSHYASNTAYQIVKGNDYEDQSSIPNCKETRFWLLSRHGTRLPEKEEIQALPELVALRNEIMENYEVKKTAPAKGALCEQDLELLKDWVPDKNITENKDEHLTVQGWNDLKNLAADYKKVFPNLLGRPYNSTKFLFRHTAKQRTQASLKAFAEGLFGEGSSRTLDQSQELANNTLLIPMSFCPEWKKDINMVNDPGSEVDKYKHSPIVMRMLADISKRLGFERVLTFQEVLLIYNMCAYESAWFLDKRTAWCTALTLDQVKIIEFENDLFYQYRSGYGNPLNSNLPCEAIKDLLDRLNSDEEPRVTAYFSHSTMIQMFATALGLFKDKSQLSHLNYDAMENRLWSSSKIDPFASNYAVVKYDCAENKEDPTPKVKFFLNQKLLEIEGCEKGLCRLDYIMSKYAKFSQTECMKTFCTKSSSSSLVATPVYSTIAALIYNWLN